MLCLCSQAVTVEGTGFTNRLGLPEPWRGVRDEALTKISGIADCCFCHAVRIPLCTKREPPPLLTPVRAVL